MDWQSSPSMARWSTADVPASQRFDYYAAALSAAQTPMSVSSDHQESFAAAMEAMDLGPLAVFHQTGSGNRAVRDQRDIERSSERSFHLLINRSSGWTLSHRGSIRLGQGDAVLTDSAIGHDLIIPGQYEFVHLKMTEAWLQQWLPGSDKLVGQRIPADAGWGRALTSFVAQLTPQLLLEPPLPLQLIGEHVGAMLSLIGTELGGGASTSRAEIGLAERICDAIVQQCTDVSLSVEKVATPLNISVRTLHRSLAGCGKTFGGVLLEARVNVAVRMLESPLLRGLTAGEIGRRAGFVDASHLARVVRARVGRTPAQLRPTGTHERSV